MEQRICLHCNKSFAKILVPGKHKRYKTEDGRFWSGGTCPDCHNEKRKGYYKNAKEKRQIVRTNRYTYFHGKRTKLRPCKDCGEMSHNYYYCPPCTNERMMSHPLGFAEAEFMSMYGVV